MKIGIAGTGRMGSAIGARLLELKHEVHVWNRSAARTRPLVEQGAVSAATPAELAGRCDAVLTILTDAAAIDAVYNGRDGLLSGDVRGKLFIEMSTVSSATERALAPAVAAKGAALVECPVGGSTAPARDGKLFGFLGGSEADVARARPIVEQLCRRVEHVGPHRRRRGDEARDQSAARRVLADLRRGAGAGRIARPAAAAARRYLLPTPPAVPTC